jgi:hypothetical protein
MGDIHYMGMEGLDYLTIPLCVQFVYNYDAFYLKENFSTWAEFTVVDNRVDSSQGGRLY